jgi:hypothetical protein
VLGGSVSRVRFGAILLTRAAAVLLTRSAAVLLARSAAVVVGVLAALSPAMSGCTEYPPYSAQEAMSRGEPIVSPADDSLKAGDPGVVTGRVTRIDTFAPAGPVAFEPVTLTRLGALVASATTDDHGAFMFVGVKGGGEYEARVASSRFVGAVRFPLRRGDHLSGLALPVQPAASK